HIGHFSCSGWTFWRSETAPHCSFGAVFLPAVWRSTPIRQLGGRLLSLHHAYLSRPVRQNENRFRFATDDRLHACVHPPGPKRCAAFAAPFTFRSRRTVLVSPPFYDPKLRSEIYDSGVPYHLF